MVVGGSSGWWWWQHSWVHAPRHSPAALTLLPSRTSPLHFSHSLVIYSQDDFDGGGTFFSSAPSLTFSASRGSGIAHPSKLEHGGAPIMRGTRYILVGFVKVLYSILYCTVLYCTVLYCTYYTILYYTILYYTILYYTIHYTILYYTIDILYYTILYYTILYYVIHQCTILYWTILSCAVLCCTDISCSGSCSSTPFLRLA
jgi:hypothetical protein